jgi:hypothetical protein
MTYCEEHPDRCFLRYRDREYQTEDQREQTQRPVYRRTLMKVEHSPKEEDSTTEYQTEDQREQTQRPVYRRRKTSKELTKFSKNMKVGSQVVEHTPKEVINAYLSQGAYEQTYKGKGEEYVRSGSSIVPELNDFKLIPKFTSNTQSVFQNTKTGEVYIAFRGSDGEFFSPEANADSIARGQGNRLKNATDWGTNIYTLKGKEHTTKRYKDAVKLAKRVANYFDIPVEELNTTGHSLGGGMSDHVSETLGTKSVSFDPARNPLAKRPVHPESKIESYSTLFDPVSVGRHIYEKIKGRPTHIKHTVYTASLGNEAGWINQHSLDEQFINPLIRNKGKIYSVRSTPLKNAGGMIGGAGGLVAEGLLPYALLPEYKTKSETAFRLGENYTDNLKITTALSHNLFEINPAFSLIDTPSLVADIMSIDPIVPPEARVWLRSKLGLKESKPTYIPPPRLIQEINKKLDKHTGRYTADEHLKQDIEQAESLGMSLEEYLQVSHGKGFEAYGKIFSEEDLAEQRTKPPGSVLQYTEQEAHNLAMKYH